MYKSVIVRDENESGLEEKINKILNGKDGWHKDFKELVSVSYSFNRDVNCYISTIYSALIIYKTN